MIRKLIPHVQRFALLAMAAGLIVVGWSVSEAKTKTSVMNVLVDITYNGPLIAQHADPAIYKHTDGFYYLAFSLPTYDKIAIRRATTVNGLAFAPETVIWTKHASSLMSANIWAPWIDFNNGAWYVYFAAAQTSSPFNHRIYVLSSTSANPLQGVWAERGQMVMNWESFTIDATTFVNGGTKFMVWAQKDPNIRNNSNIYIAKMTDSLTISGTQVMISQPQYAWEEQTYKVNEAPAVLLHGGNVYITYSASATDASYAMGLLTAAASADLLSAGSWSKSPTPVFQTSVAHNIYGPGSNTFTTDSDGVTVQLYNARSYKDIKGDPLYDPNRAIYVQTVNFNSDGSPNFGVPSEQPVF